MGCAAGQPLLRLMQLKFAPASHTAVQSKPYNDMRLTLSLHVACSEVFDFEQDIPLDSHNLASNKLQHNLKQEGIGCKGKAMASTVDTRILSSCAGARKHCCAPIANDAGTAGDECKALLHVTVDTLISRRTQSNNQEEHLNACGVCSLPSQCYESCHPTATTGSTRQAPGAMSPCHSASALPTVNRQHLDRYERNGVILRPTLPCERMPGDLTRDH